MSPFHKLILSHLTDYADELAEQVTTDTLEHATSLRDTADAELQEQLDDHRLEFAVLKEDGLMEMRRLCDAKLQELDERTTELVESVEQETADAYTAAREKLKELVGEQRMTLIKELLRLDSELRQRQGSPTEEPVRRARSVPLESGW
jgi:F0F1-type ATP synthase membrane subunit b/b'